MHPSSPIAPPSGIPEHIRGRIPSIAGASTMSGIYMGIVDQPVPGMRTTLLMSIQALLAGPAGKGR